MIDFYETECCKFRSKDTKTVDMFNSNFLCDVLVLTFDTIKEETTQDNRKT